MAKLTPSELGKRGWQVSGHVWIKLIVRALEIRGIVAHWQQVEKIIRKVFENNAFEGGNLGYQTIDSYVGLLQATDQLDVPIKCHSIDYHRNRLNLSPKGYPQKKKFDADLVFNRKPRPKSTEGTSIIKSKW